MDKGRVDKWGDRRDRGDRRGEQVRVWVTGIGAGTGVGQVGGGQI